MHPAGIAAKDFPADDSSAVVGFLRPVGAAAEDTAPADASAVVGFVYSLEPDTDAAGAA